MKRLVIRISVLAIVVVLGVIAIARAQRSMRAPSATASASSDAPVISNTPVNSTGQVSSAATVDQAAPVPLAVVAGGAPAPLAVVAGEAPQALPDTVHVNPLRPLPPDAQGGAVATSGASSDASGIGTAERAVSELPSQPAVDPFGPPLATPAKNPSASGQADGPAISITANGPRPSDRPARDGSDRSLPPSMPPLLQTVPASTPGVAARANGNLADPPRSPAAAESRPVAPAGEIPDAGEPARLSAVQGLPMDLGAGGGTGTPGGKQLEGAQSPQVTVEKTAPPEIQVGKPATFKIKVRNVGQVAAHVVEIHDEIPKGTRLLSTNPQASQGVGGGELVWSLGTMPPGDERSVEVQVMPMEEGEIGSVATVRLAAQASARTVATKPELVIECRCPSRCWLGSR